MNKEFLLEILKTESPSGYEVELQKKWLNYVKKFVKVRYDNIGNAYGIVNEKAKFKILLAGHADEIAFMVRKIDENGYIYFTKLGGINVKAAIGMRIIINGYMGEKIVGVVGVNAEHHGGVKEKLEIEDIYLDCGFEDKQEANKYVQIGDLAVYDTQPLLLRNNRITSKALDNKTGSFIVAEVLKRLSKEKINVAVYGVSTVNEETNMGGAYFAASQINPDMAIACDVTFATDYPDSDPNKYGDIKIDKGPVLAKGAPINFKINNFLEETANKFNINLQYELTPRATGTDADRIRLTGKGVPIALVSLPIRYMHSPVELASLKDIQEEINLLVEMIKSLPETPNINPLD
ncbi:endoglucanase [Hypnocyclicus thermotrophus]|uniref:Endoglucanase n=1 Tax=Hypnocyclicus thermotrophus TaxID=1627895 RepID=A0AA46DYM9_9FUSO|nr:M20/M25/M40 family metallo-hydrolase [Hypnocyclicus thermotrophus]TDT70547.1 endoglucanase [Hypnocyclicus thermotrophus]